MFRWRTEECWLDSFLNCRGGEGGGREGVNTCIPKQTYIPVICQDARAHVCVFACVYTVSGTPPPAFFFSPQLILQRSNGQFQRNLSFFKVPEGVQHFPGGGPTFTRGGVQLLIPYRNPYNL